MIDVCICTYRRQSIVQTIESLAAQKVLPDGQDIRVVVADNDIEPSARDAVEAACATAGLPLRYVHAPAQNISIARNACLDAASAEWIAFIDDDECASGNWLDRLFAGSDQSDIVFGISKALIGKEDVAAWMADGSAHSNTLSGNDKIHNGYTCNVLMRRDFIVGAGLRFSLALGRTGGEDTVFFDDARKAGARFHYTADAIVYEDIPDSRANLGWLLRRRFRAGQIHCLLKRRNNELHLKAVSSGFAKAAYCAGLSVLMSFVPRRRAAALMRGALHVGFLSSALGLRTYEEYR